MNRMELVKQTELAMDERRREIVHEMHELLYNDSRYTREEIRLKKERAGKSLFYRLTHLPETPKGIPPLSDDERQMLIKLNNCLQNPNTMEGMREAVQLLPLGVILATADDGRGLTYTFYQNDALQGIKKLLEKLDVLNHFYSSLNNCKIDTVYIDTQEIEKLQLQNR